MKPNTDSTQQPKVRELLDKFPFIELLACMKAVGWTYDFKTPTIADLVFVAAGCLESVCAMETPTDDNEDGCMSQSGGFCARKYSTGELELEFHIHGKE
jgi:hypothetical protein